MEVTIRVTIHNVRGKITIRNMETLKATRLFQYHCPIIISEGLMRDLTERVRQQMRTKLVRSEVHTHGVRTDAHQMDDETIIEEKANENAK